VGSLSWRVHLSRSKRLRGAARGEVDRPATGTSLDMICAAHLDEIGSPARHGQRGSDSSVSREGKRHIDGAAPRADTDSFRRILQRGFAGRVFGNLHVRGNADQTALVQHTKEAGNPIGIRDLRRRKHAPIYKGEITGGYLAPLPANVSPETPVVIVI